MSSRILSRGAELAVQPMVWAQMDGSRAPMEILARPAGGEAAETDRLQANLRELNHRVEIETAAAYRKGFEEGAGEQNARSSEEVREAVQRLAVALAEAAALRPRLRQEAEYDMVKLALAIARKVLRREMSIDPSAMQALVRVALEKLQRQEILRVYIHPQQAAAVEAALEAQGVRSVEVIAEMSRDVGSLVLETNRGKLDASVLAQLEEIELGLTDRVARI